VREGGGAHVYIDVELVIYRDLGGLRDLGDFLNIRDLGDLGIWVI
jgi:hypothetical protein